MFRIAAITKDYEKQLSEKDAVIKGLAAELAHTQALFGRDSTNTSTPVGQTPPWKEKHIPNSRRIRGSRKAGSAGMSAISWKSLNRKKRTRK